MKDRLSTESPMRFVLRDQLQWYGVNTKSFDLTVPLCIDRQPFQQRTIIPWSSTTDFGNLETSIAYLPYLAVVGKSGTPRP